MSLDNFIPTTENLARITKFVGSVKSEAEAARNAYFSRNSSLLVDDIMIILEFGNNRIFQIRSNGTWESQETSIEPAELSEKLYSNPDTNRLTDAMFNRLSGQDLIVERDLTVKRNIVVNGTVDGRDIAADGAKLDGVDAGAEVNSTLSYYTLPARNITSGTLNAGTIVVSDGQNDAGGGRSQVSIYRNRGQDPELYLPVGVLVKNVASFTDVREAIATQGDLPVIQSGLTLSLGDKVYLTKAGTGQGEHWEFSASSTNNFEVGRVTQVTNQATGSYELDIDFNLARADAIARGLVPGTEAIQDIVGAMVSGAGSDIAYDDAAGTLTGYKARLGANRTPVSYTTNAVLSLVDSSLTSPGRRFIYTGSTTGTITPVSASSVNDIGKFWLLTNNSSNMSNQTVVASAARTIEGSTTDLTLPHGSNVLLRIRNYTEVEGSPNITDYEVLSFSITGGGGAGGAGMMSSVSSMLDQSAINRDGAVSHGTPACVKGQDGTQSVIKAALLNPMTGVYVGDTADDAMATIRRYGVITNAPIYDENDALITTVITEGTTLYLKYDGSNPKVTTDSDDGTNTIFGQVITSAVPEGETNAVHAYYFDAVVVTREMLFTQVSNLNATVNGFNARIQSLENIVVRTAVANPTYNMTGTNIVKNTIYAVQGADNGDKTFNLPLASAFNLTGQQAFTFWIENTFATRWIKVVNNASNGNFHGMSTGTFWIKPGEMREFRVVRDGANHRIHVVGRVSYKFSYEKGLLGSGVWLNQNSLPTEILEPDAVERERLVFKTNCVIEDLRLAMNWVFTGTAAADFSGLRSMTPSANLLRNGSNIHAGNDAHLLNLSNSGSFYTLETDETEMNANQYLTVTGTDTTDVSGTGLYLRGEIVLKFD